MSRLAMAAALGSLVVACSSTQGGLDDSFYVGEDQGSVRTPGDGGSAFVTSNVSPSSCAANGIESKLTPVRLAFIFDKSGSMGNDEKWSSATGALRDFFADANSTGVSASLQFFPSGNDQCDGNGYAMPEVAMKALPDAVTFANAMSKRNPDGATPTLPALQGAVEYAKQQATLNPNERSLVVLVTDGEPNGCSSTIDAVSQTALDGANKNVLTYVVGVGPLLDNLNKIAQAGGTQKAILVPTNNPSQAKDELQKALQSIRGKAMCELAIPAAAPGTNLDFQTVNVAFTPAGGAKETLTYDKDCTAGAGWHYDDPAKPSKISLCAASCAAIQKASGGKVELSIGCATKGGVK